MLTVEVCGQPIFMELHPGASVSVMAGKVFKRTYPGLQRLQRDDILVTVKSSEWAAPSVAVLKQYGSVRICGDFKITINPVATDAGLKVKLEKCIFFAPSVEYLEYVISQAGLARKELQSSLALVNFYRTLLPNLSSHLQPLHLLLRDVQQWAWKKKQEVAFQRTKELITKAPLLLHFDQAKPVILTRYSQMDQEGQAVMFGVDRFHHYLWSGNFEEVTNHKPLLAVLRPDKVVPVHASSLVVRWAFRLASYNFQLVYHPGMELAPADALRRLPLPDVPSAVPEPAEVGGVTGDQPGSVLSQVVKAVSRGEELAEQTPSHKAAELTLQQGCLLTLLARCRATKSAPWPFSVRPWSHLHVDFGGTFNGYYFLVVVDTFSKWVEVLPVTTPSAGATIAALRQVFEAQALPDVIVFDN
ncbi:uncharacterized protein LOC144164871 [Haemaphysalis longicornis]